MAITVPTIPAAAIDVTSTTVYTVPNTAGCYVIVKGIIITNTGASSTTVSLARVASGGTASNSNRFLKDVAVNPGESVFLSDTITLGPNESIRGTAGITGQIVVTMSAVGKLS